MTHALGRQRVWILSKVYMPDHLMYTCTHQPTRATRRGGSTTRMVQVWSDVVMARRLPTYIDRWFSEYLERPVELVSVVSVLQHDRKLDPKCVCSVLLVLPCTRNVCLHKVRQEMRNTLQLQMVSRSWSLV